MRLFFVSLFLMLSTMVCAMCGESIHVVHVFVALCDNEHQGIVKVPAALGNGQDPKNNLYWGAQFGVKQFLSRSNRWRVIRTGIRPENPKILERAVFFQDATNTWLVADAYDGRYIRDTITDVLYPHPHDEIKDIGAGGASLFVGSRADLRCYVGHNGLMEFLLPQRDSITATRRNIPLIILACKSRPYFIKHLSTLNLDGLLLTEGLMAPEAYTLDAAVTAWAQGKDRETIRQAAAATYAGYQKISSRAGDRLFSTIAPSSETQMVTSIPREEIIMRSNRTIADIPCPQGYARLPWKGGTLSAYTEHLPCKGAGSPVRSWRGDVVQAGNSVTAVIDWPAPTRVQQCADVAIRLYAEFQTTIGSRRFIAFRTLSNDLIRYGDWLRGRYSLNTNGTRIVYTPGTKRTDTDAELEQYLQFVMTYANSASLARDLPKIKESEIRPGDLYIQPDPQGGIGHVSIVLSVCAKGTARRYLFGYGFIPAQDFHLPKSPTGAWFTLEMFKGHVSNFGSGAFHRFE